jgi:acyl carrier protein
MAPDPVAPDSVVPDSVVSGAATDPEVAERLAGRLRDSWRRVEGLTDIGIDDDLPSLAAQSVTLIQLVVRIQEEHGVAVPLEVFFEAPTLRAVAQAIIDGEPR